MTQTHFTPELFQFLLELRTNNNREWFQDNKGRYELHVKEPILQFIQDFEPSLHSVSTRFIADARGQRRLDVPHLQGRAVLEGQEPVQDAGGGTIPPRGGASRPTRPDSTCTSRPARSSRASASGTPTRRRSPRYETPSRRTPVNGNAPRRDPDFLTEYSIGGESLKRPPKGFDPDHQYIDDLKRKDHIASVEFDEGDAVAPDFLDEFADVCRQASPYMEFLTTALGLPY